MSDNVYIVASVICFAAALALFFLELFIPSGGLIGVLASVSLVAAVTLLFGVSTTAGLIGLVVTLAGLPVLFAVALKVWPQTWIARALTLHSTTPAKDAANPPRDTTWSHLIGAEGRAATDLHPIGACDIQGQRMECLAEGGLIRAGQTVRVTTVDGMHIKVRAVI
ncbi:MAG: hypothetical protein IT440_10510 [Phycisphaeraceae bacterium]|nr:hypothetical protein [Phycisphaeraceae bacterium]